MPDILVRDLPKKTVEKLKKRAKRHNRSLQQEVRTVLDETAHSDLRDHLEVARRLRAKIRRSHPNQSDSVELIREDRER